MADVTVFVDRAVQGQLPGVCVIDGVDTTDSLAVRQGVGDGAGRGVAWLLVLAGPLGWLGLLLLAPRSNGAEVLTVRLPYSYAAYTRSQAERRERRTGWALVTAGVVIGLVAAIANLWPALAALAIVAAVTAGVWGVVMVTRSGWRLGRLTVGIELDASRRWVTLRGVHPRFAAATNPTDELRPTP